MIDMQLQTNIPLIYELKVFETVVTAPSGMIHHEYFFHKLMWKAFPDKVPGTVQPFIFKKMNISGNAYMMRSLERPISGLVGGLKCSVLSKKYSFQISDAFSINVLMCQQTSRQAHNKKTRISEGKDLDNWLSRRAEEAGFELGDHQLIIQKNILIEGSNNHQIALPACQLQAQVVINDPQKFKNSMTYGMGPKAGFGFGYINIPVEVLAC